MKLLLIEDHRDIAGVVFDYFEIKGHALDYASNGKHGLALCSKHHYDVIILEAISKILKKQSKYSQFNESRIIRKLVFKAI